MQLTLSLVLAAIGTTAVSGAALPEARNVNGTGRAATKAFSVSEWTDRGCSQNQNTWALHDKKCYEPSSTSGSLEIWYMDPGCKLGLYKNYCGDDKNIAMWNPGTYQCLDLVAMGVTHYQLYC